MLRRTRRRGCRGRGRRPTRRGLCPPRTPRRRAAHPARPPARAPPQQAPLRRQPRRGHHLCFVIQIIIISHTPDDINIFAIPTDTGFKIVVFGIFYILVRFCECLISLQNEPPNHVDTPQSVRKSSRKVTRAKKVVNDDSDESGK